VVVVLGGSGGGPVVVVAEGASFGAGSLNGTGATSPPTT
jgi:hypothetical protein